eukprot:11276447-Alexandrium_andersonii.AAC.1
MATPRPGGGVAIAKDCISECNWRRREAPADSPHPLGTQATPRHTPRPTHLANQNDKDTAGVLA